MAIYAGALAGGGGLAFSDLNNSSVEAYLPDLLVGFDSPPIALQEGWGPEAIAREVVALVSEVEALLGEAVARAQSEDQDQPPPSLHPLHGSLEAIHLNPLMNSPW